MERKKYVKPVHSYKVEFKEYGKTVSQEVIITAYSEKQAKKFFYDWWKNHHQTYALVILVGQLDDAYARALCSRVEGCSMEERLELQNDYIYRGKNRDVN